MEENFWLIISALLVFTMQAGFLCLESGRIRSKNSINVAAKNVADFIIAVALFWAIGFAVMFGQSFHGLIGVSDYAFDESHSTWVISFFLFQLMFCGTATTIMSGAVAERMSFNGYLWSACILSAVIYPVVGHWAWGGLIDDNNAGWLQRLGFIDFAGSMVVHGVGGCVSLVAVLIIGPRFRRFSREGQMPQGSNLPFSALGVLLLWFGWFGFNGGSSLIFDQSVPVVLLNTCLAAAFGGIMTGAINYVQHKYIDVTMLLNGIVGGLVGITAGCFAVSASSAVIIGVVAGIIVYYGELWLLHLKIDDAIGVIPAHLFCGIWGVLSVGLLGDLSIMDTGLSRIHQVLVQILGILVICGWCFAVGYVCLRLVNRFIPLRVSLKDEKIGMNVSEHHSATELLDLLVSMQAQQKEGDFSQPVPEEPFTEVGIIAQQYNQVIKRVNTEIEARDSAIEQYQSSEQRKSAILDSSMDCIVTIDEMGTILEFNPSAERAFDWARTLIQGKSFIEYLVPKSQQYHVLKSLHHRFSMHDGLLLNRRNNLTMKRKGDSEFPAEVSITYSKSLSGNRGEYVLNIRDVTRHKKLQAKLRQLAYSDPLTGLYNRTYLIDCIDKALKQFLVGEESIVVFFLDLDKFKRINDTMGHKAGDGLLCEVASRLTTVTRESDVITRWGGDEFIILMRGRITHELARQKAEEILSIMRSPVDLDGYLVNIPTSIGIAITKTQGISADKLIQCADIAMYDAKVKGRDNYQFFEESMALATTQRYTYEHDLREDLWTDKVFLLYQPKVMQDGTIIGMEALCRWNHREEGMVSPAQFIPIAEESNLIIELGERVIDSACKQIRQWKNDAIPVVPISINISGKQLTSSGFIHYLQSKLEETDVDGRLLEIEITESVLVSDIERCISAMSSIRALGMRISIDDFGTGYSSLNYLKRLPIDVLKIDKSFVNECDVLMEDGKICSTIISLAHNLDLETVAEGVETQSQLMFLSENGCEYFQGYLFHRPLSTEELTPLLKKIKLPHSFEESF
ncbi:ammonium transporter [Vibrio sp.]|nr:ammonium transporter [Vibrio sp.]